MKCTGCRGVGCRLCSGGNIEIDRCPLELITADIWDFIRCAKLFFKGCPPVAGGTLDQSHWFTEAAEFYAGETAYWKNKFGVIS